MSRRFRHWREEKKLTLEAVRLEVNKHLPEDDWIKSTSTIDNYEGNYLPSTKFLIAVKKAYPDDLDLNWLMFGDKGAPGDVPFGPPPRMSRRRRKLGRRYFKRWKPFGGGVGIIDGFLRRLHLFYPHAYASGKPFELAISDPKARICELDKWLEKWALSPFGLPIHFIGIEELTQAEAVTYCHALLAALGPLLRPVRDDKLPAQTALPPGFDVLFSGPQFEEFRDQVRREL